MDRCARSNCPDHEIEMDWSQIEVVSWDLDGTLYKTADMHRALARRFFTALWSLQLRRSVGTLSTVARHFRLDAKLRADGGQLDPYPQFWRSAAYSNLLANWVLPAITTTGLRSGVVPLLDAIAASGRRQVIVSDFLADAKLDALGVHGRFERVFAGQAIGYLKPSPHLFEHVLTELGLRPEQLLHIGDRHDTDGLGAAAAGVACMICDDGFENVQRVVSQPQA